MYVLTSEVFEKYLFLIAFEIKTKPDLLSYQNKCTKFIKSENSSHPFPYDLNKKRNPQNLKRKTRNKKPFAKHHFTLPSLKQTHCFTYPVFTFRRQVSLGSRRSRCQQLASRRTKPIWSMRCRLLAGIYGVWIWLVTNLFI